MPGLPTQRSLWPLTVSAILGSALIVQACSGRVQNTSDCGGDSSCSGGSGAAGGRAGAGTAAVAASAGNSGTGNDTLNACTNNARDSDESDVDCGGNSKCARCAAGSRCKTSGDCESELCAGNLCADPSCTDGLKNQDETGVDCGGTCLSCDDGAPCMNNEDCSSQYCVHRACADHCSSGVRESDETDTDCGGATCKPCADNRRCSTASDCQSFVCSGKSCQPATCSDKVKNQDESDKDCGGSCSATAPCAVKASCNTAADCESWICSAHKCAADIVLPASDIIDDFEDQDLLLPASPARGGRVGTWYAYGDGTGTASEGVSSINRGASLTGLHASGMGFKSWGSGIGVDLNNSSTSQTRGLYDAAAYSGITFWARAKTATSVTVSLPDADTDAAGNICTTCDHHYFKRVSVGEDWQRFTIAFSDLSLEPGTVPVPSEFKPSGVTAVRFGLAPGGSYDLYLDDLAFVK